MKKYGIIKLIALLIALTLAVTLFAGCSSNNASDAGDSSSSSDSAATDKKDDTAADNKGDDAASDKVTVGDAGKTYKIGFANSSLANPWRVGIQNAIEAEVAKIANAEFVTNQADEDATTLNNNVEDLIAQACDIILVCTVDGDTFENAALDCQRAGIPLIFCDRGITTSENYTSYIQQSNIALGADSADWLAEQLTAKYGSAKGKVVELQGTPGNLPAEERKQGFHETIEEKYPDIEIVSAQPTDYTRTNALEVMENVIQACPEIDAVFTHEDEIAIGAIQALEEANRLEDTIIIGDGGSRDALNYIKEGKMTMTMSYSPVDFGIVGVQTAIAVLNGETVDQVIQITGQVVDKDNVDSLLAKMDELSLDFVSFLSE